MSDKKNLPASVLARLKNIAKQNHVVYSEILSRYVIERFLKRIETSDYASHFILKGGTLFILWSKGFDYRPTMDADLEFRGKGSPEVLTDLFQKLTEVDYIEEDGVRFDPSSVRAKLIREADDYGGVRVTFFAFIGSVRVPVQFDVGIGDAITPTAQRVTFPSLLDIPAPKIRVYPKETVIAEKIETIVKRGLANSRLKDYYDLWILCNDSELRPEIVRKAIERTFARRKTPIPTIVPDGLAHNFSENEQKRIQWNAFLRKNRLDVNGLSFTEIVTAIRQYILPLLNE